MRLNNHSRLAKTLCSWLLLGTFFIFCHCAMAQTKTTIPIDDTELYVGALRMVETLHNDAAQSGSSGAAAIDMALQREMNVSSADFAVLIHEATLEDSTIEYGNIVCQAV